MLLQDAYTYLERRTALDSNDTTAKARMRDAMTFALKEMCRRCRFIAMEEEGTFSTVDGTYFYYLEPRVLYLKDARDTTNDNILEMWSPRKFNKEYPDPDISSTSEGTSTILVPMKRVWVSAQPTAASTLSFTSSSASDITSYKCYVRGVAGGIEVSESVTLNGATAVATSNSYTEVYSITKDTTNGTVTVTSNSAAVTVVSLLAGEKEKAYWKIRLHVVPDGVHVIKYTYRRTPWDFSTDEDLIPIDPRFEDAFLDFTESQLLKWQRDEQWQVVYQGAVMKMGEVMDNDYFAEDEDKRMGLIEISGQEYEDWE